MRVVIMCCMHVVFFVLYFVLHENFLALILWDFVLYFSACGTRSGIVEFRVIYFPPVLYTWCMNVVTPPKKTKTCCIFCVWRALWYFV